MPKIVHSQKAIQHAKSLDFDVFQDAMDSGQIETVDGFMVEPDGIDQNGNYSPMVILGWI